MAQNSIAGGNGDFLPGLGHAAPLPPGAKVGCYFVLPGSAEPVFLAPTEAGPTAVRQILAEVGVLLAEKEAAMSERLKIAEAKEEAIRELIAAQHGFLAELINRPAEFGKKVGSAEVARELSVSPRSVREYAKKGIIPSRKIGKHWRYDLKEIHDAVERDQREKKSGLTAAARARVLR